MSKSLQIQMCWQSMMIHSQLYWEPELSQLYWEPENWLSQLYWEPENWLKGFLIPLTLFVARARTHTQVLTSPQLKKMRACITERLDRDAQITPFSPFRRHLSLSLAFSLSLSLVLSLSPSHTHSHFFSLQLKSHTNKNTKSVCVCVCVCVCVYAYMYIYICICTYVHTYIHIYIYIYIYRDGEEVKKLRGQREKRTRWDSKSVPWHA